MTTDELMKYFDFDEFDLDLNRNGSLSPKQMARISKSDISLIKVFWLIGLVFAAIALLLVFWFILKSLAWYIVFWAIPSGFLAFVLIRAAIRIKSTKYTLEKAEGPVELERSVGIDDPDAGYQLFIEENEFSIGHKLGRSLKAGDVYAVYYYWEVGKEEPDNITDGNILSMEFLSKKG
jgi:glucan phosphoethanolaminetransferase (alkaline phosphatase superfamily)